MLPHVYPCRLDHGALKLDGGRFRAEMAELGTVEGLELIVRTRQSQRSLDQNAYLHGVVFKLLAEHFGDSVQGVKHDLMGECWGWTVSKVRGQPIPIRLHTSEMSTTDCAYFIDWVIPWAATEHGVMIPLPNEELEYLRHAGYPEASTGRA